MSLEKSDVPREVYVLESGDTVQTAKSQFCDEYDVRYDETNGSIISNSGGYSHTQELRSRYPCLCVVVHAP